MFNHKGGSVGFRVGLACGASLLALATEAAAQTVDQITVFAQRREQSAQDVPISITAYSAEDLQEGGIDRVEDYFRTTPNVFITDGATRNANEVTQSSLGLSIRGISNVGGNASSFGIYLDEFNISHISLNPHLFDMQRVEVLRGPQGTYFGRNASGGVVNLTTQEASSEALGAGASFQYGRFNTREATGYVNVPMGERAALRVSGRWNDSDGAFVNALPASDGNSFNHGALRVAFHAEPVDNLTVDLSYNFVDEKDDDFGIIHTGVLMGFTEFLCSGPSFTCPVDVDLGLYPENRRVYAHDAPLVVDNEYNITTGRVKWSNDQVAITSITGYGFAKFKRSGELDFSSLDHIREPNNDNSRRSFSQELRLQSANDSAVQWIVGGVFARDKINERELIQAGLDIDAVPPLTVFEDSNFDQTITSKAVFAEVSVDVTNALNLTVGGRYSHDMIERSEGDLAALVTGEQTFDDFSPRFAVNYAATDNVNLYATVAKGWKSGGFELDPDLVRSDFGDESLWNYEAGIKSELFDRRLRANLSVYYIDWSDIQVRTGIFRLDTEGNVESVPGISNAASATSKGVELDLLAVPTDNLEIGMSIGYMDAHFGDFTEAVTSYGTVDLSDRPLPKAPDVTFSTYAQYRAPLFSDFEGFIRGEFQYIDDTLNTVNDVAAIATGAGPFPFLAEGYGKTNLRIGVENDRYSLVGYVENLFDNEYYTSTYDFVFANGAAVYPSYRDWGVRLSVKF